MKSHKKTHPAVRTLYILLLSMCTMFSINAQITHIPRRVSHTQVKNKKLYKYKAPLIDSVATRLKKLKTALWGNDSWQKNYLKRIITLSLCTLSTCIAQDIWAHNTNITHGKLENEKNQKIQESVRTKANNSEPVSTKENIELQSALVRNSEARLRLRQIVTDLDTECEQTLEAENNTALEIQRKDDAFKAHLDILPSLFAQAISDNRLEEAIRLLTEGEEDPSYIEISTAFARTVHQKFNIDKYTLNPDDHIKHIITVTSEQMIYTENSTHNTIINVFKIALKLKNCRLAERCISANSYSAEEQVCMLSEAYKYQWCFIVATLKKTFAKEYEVPKSSSDRHFDRLILIDRVKNLQIDFGSMGCVWNDAVTENDHQAISLMLRKTNSNSFDATTPYDPIFNSNNLYALSSLLSKKKELANNNDIEDAAHNTLLDIYLVNTCGHIYVEGFEHRPKTACPLMVKLLINAGVHLKDLGRTPLLPSQKIYDNCSSFQQSSLGRFMLFARKNPDPDGERERIVQLLIAERDKVNVSSEEALYAASIMGLRDYVYDIIVTSKKCIHPRLLETFWLLTSPDTRVTIRNAHNRRMEMQKAQGYEEPEADTSADNSLLLSALNMPTDLTKIIWEYAADAPSTSTHVTPLPQNKED